MLVGVIFHTNIGVAQWKMTLFSRILGSRKTVILEGPTFDQKFRSCRFFPCYIKVLKVIFTIDLGKNEFKKYLTKILDLKNDQNMYQNPTSQRVVGPQPLTKSAHNPPNKHTSGPLNIHKAGIEAILSTLTKYHWFKALKRPNFFFCQ